MFKFLCHFNLEISKDHHLGNQLTSPWLLQTKARSSSRTTVGSPPVTKLLACTFQLISFFHLWTELTLTLDEPRQYLEKSDILHTKAILILDPYPLFWLLSVIAPVFSFCFSSQIFQENVCCFLKRCVSLRIIFIQSTLWQHSSNKAPPKTWLTALQWTAAAICCRCCSSSAVSSAADAKLVCWPNQRLSLIHIWRCRRLLTCRSRWSPYH